MKISMIVAHGKNRELGLNNELLWHIPEDLKSFKRITEGHTVIMGRKTFDSIINFLGKPLPNRTSIVLSRSRKQYSEYPTNQVQVWDDLDEALYNEEVGSVEEVFIIGGAEIYNTFIDRVNTLYVSEVDFEGKADVFLKEIDYSQWNLIGVNSHPETTKKDGSAVPAWELKIYERI